MLNRVFQNFSRKYAIKTHLIYILWVVIVCAITTTLSVYLNKKGIGKENSLLIFLIGVLAITVLTKGYIYGFIASVASVLMFNYFFAVPLQSFAVSKTQDFILVSFFLLAALICGTMSSKFQRQTEIAKQKEKTAQLLYNISKSFLNLAGTVSIVNNGIHYIKEYTGYPCCVILDKDKFNLTENHFYSPDFKLQELEEGRCYTLPIKDLTNQIGTIALSQVKPPLSYENNMLIKSVVYHMTLVLDREFIYNERERIKLAMESEHLKSTLLRSISHDIRTPLTGILGASSIILDARENLDEAAIKRLASDIKEETARLINSVQNILDMTRISEGKLVVKKEFEAVDDLINQTVRQVAWFSGTNRLHIEVPKEIIMVETDGRLLVQALVNLLDNAYKHSGNDTKIELKAYKAVDNVIFEVSDNGPGIDEAVKDTLFDGFVTLPRNVSDSSRGVGLGLAICKAIVDAHGGKVTAFNKPEGGAVFRIELPCEEEQG